ncbi:Rad24p [Sporobolomyces koalae]|uniref:Rad24p n=1 Tax=Sporobolomyces koalae TaxID=500713 RepID=UPI00316E9BE3
MPRGSTDSNSSSKQSDLRQFNITSFLPQGFGSQSNSGTAPIKVNKKRRRAPQSDEVEEEIENLDDDNEHVQTTGPLRVDEKPLISPGATRIKKHDPCVIDLTLSDDDIMQPPPVPIKAPKKKTKTAAAGSKKDNKGKQVETRSDEMWTDKFAPTSREELAVHAKKVTDVANWFNEAFPAHAGGARLAKYRRLLVLSGPAGSGKTACLRMLAQDSGVEILEWKEESNVQNANDDSRDSMMNRFTSFLARAGMAPSLDFVDSSSELDSAPIASTSKSGPHLASISNVSTRRLILLEDLPNISHYPTKLALRSALQQFLTSPRVTCPLVLIVSEAFARPGVDSNEISASGGGWLKTEDSIDSRAVCGVQVLQHPACREISFNPIAVTIMKKALNRILDQVYDSSIATGSRPSASTLDLLIQHSNGDIRSALMSLQFLASDGTVAPRNGTQSHGAGASKGRGKKKDKESTGDARNLLQFVTSRENSLFIFHALGKVLYNKRWGQSATDDKKDLNRPGILQERTLDKLPKHLREEWGRPPSKVDPDVLFAEAPIDSDIFLTYLHHNYPQFTNQSIESCSTILEGLSASDSLLRIESDDSPFRRAPLTSLYSFSVAVRTTLLGLPSPVERTKQVLRKSELWDNEKLRRSNEEGVLELTTNGAIYGSTKQSGTIEEEEENGRRLSGWRNKKDLLTETIPWIGIIKPPHPNAFLLDLAQFPPLSFDSSSSALSGVALGEKDIKLEEAEDAEQEGTAQGSGVKRLEEVETGVTESSESWDVAAIGGSWYEEEDDIIVDNE